MPRLRASSACLTRISLDRSSPSRSALGDGILEDNNGSILRHFFRVNGALFLRFLLYTSPLTMLLQVEYDALATAFNSISLSLPESPPGSRLPLAIDIEFAQEEGTWPAFNKAMHAAFGDKSKGLKIEERG
ncbi:hypothetical protein M422DRAFT_256979 [Sphaerobolus stellatus SS14]|uniref:Unplaced genomic scaffold SPHSTscaffold_71, whole genome shotgun sequence n=1 Tax=Sphaerobolus stellatus (strain SS14) TaxID=990650 RepID=A0A0C9VPQ6_SPHS4|nr:hypothetical protein M422DRAFT_256979 [Sphaerobolus stellatus SS14]